MASYSGVGGISEGLEQSRRILQFMVTGRGHIHVKKPPQPGLGKRPDKSHVFPRKSTVPEAGWLSRFLVSTENDGGLPGSPSHLLSRMSPRMDTLAFEGIYRDSCCPPPGRGDIRPTLGTEKSLYVSSGTAAPPRSSHRGSLFPCLDRAPGAPMPSARCSGSQASLAWATQPFYQAGLQAEVDRSLIGSFSVHPPHPIGPALGWGGAL